jgi:copper oxidase (laccase) domain-containing protein
LLRGIKCMSGRAANLHVHFGPAICGECYEVGPEVHIALGLPETQHNGLIDIRGVLAQQAMKAGVPEANITTSTFCTRCGDSPFFSHRGGSAERQVGVIGITARHG